MSSKKNSNEDQHIIYDVVQSINQAYAVRDCELGTGGNVPQLQNTQESGVYILKHMGGVDYRLEVAFRVVRTKQGKSEK